MGDVGNTYTEKQIEFRGKCIVGKNVGGRKVCIGNGG